MFHHCVSFTFLFLLSLLVHCFHFPGFSFSLHTYMHTFCKPSLHFEPPSGGIHVSRPKLDHLRVIFNILAAAVNIVSSYFSSPSPTSLFTPTPNPYSNHNMTNPNPDHTMLCRPPPLRFHQPSPRNIVRPIFLRPHPVPRS